MIEVKPTKQRIERKRKEAKNLKQKRKMLTAKIKVVESEIRLLSLKKKMGKKMKAGRASVVRQVRTKFAMKKKRSC